MLDLALSRTVNTTPHTSHFLFDLHPHAWLKSCLSCTHHVSCDLGTHAEYDPLTGSEPNDLHISETTENYSSKNLLARTSPWTRMALSSMTTPSAWRSLHHCSPKSEKMMRAVDKLITLLTKVCRPVSRRPSVMIERWDPLWNRLTHKFQTPEKFRATAQRVSESGFFWNDKENRFSLIVKQRFENTNSRPIVTEEVFKSCMKRSSRRKEKFIVLIKETNNVDKINNFFMNSYWSKSGFFVKLIRKVSVRWENWSDFKAVHSMLRGEIWSKIEIVSLNSQARYRNHIMKSIASMIREIFKMLNQYAVDIPTLPVSQCFRHLSQILLESWAVLWECQAATTGRQAFGTHMVYRETSLQIQQRLLQHLIRKSRIRGSLLHHNRHHHMWWVKAKHQFGIRDASQDRRPEIQSSLVREDFQRNMGQTNNDCRLGQILHTSNVRLLEEKIHDWSMYLFTVSYGTYAVDQRSGTGWFSGWSKIFVFCERNSNARFWSTRCEDCISIEQNHQ